MSALPIIESRPERAERLSTLSIPQTRFRVALQTRTIPQTRTQDRVLDSAFARGARLFGFWFVLAFMSSSLAGNLFVERAHASEASAIARYRDARKAEDVLDESVRRLKAPDAIDRWALAHGFLAPLADATRSNGQN